MSRALERESEADLLEDVVVFLNVKDNHTVLGALLLVLLQELLHARGADEALARQLGRALDVVKISDMSLDAKEHEARPTLAASVNSAMTTSFDARRKGPRMTRVVDAHLAACDEHYVVVRRHARAAKTEPVWTWVCWECMQQSRKEDAFRIVQLTCDCVDTRAAPWCTNEGLIEGGQPCFLHRSLQALRPGVV